MMLLSLVVAIIFGTGDFCGGMATKRAKALQVVAVSHAVGLVGVVIASVAIGNSPSTRDLILGAAGGICGGCGVFFLYRCLARGPMSVVAPITAITSALVPAAWGILDGERMSGLVWLGLGLALAAIGMVSWSPNDEGAAVTTTTVIESLAAGLGFGSFFIFIDATLADSAPWPIVGARTTTTCVLIAFLALTKQPVLPTDRATGGWMVLAGVFDTLSNVLFLYATNQGDLTLVSIVTSLYPAATVVLAWAFLGERMSKVQGAGFAVALVATALIGAG